MTVPVIDSFELSDLLTKLVDRSLVTFDPGSGRFRLLETVRQYSAELESHTDDVAERRDRHLDYFIQFCGENFAKIRGRDQAEWLARFDADFDNIRIAVEWGLSSEDGWLGALELVSNAGPYWIVRSRLVEAGQWFQQLKSLEPSALDNRSQSILTLIQAFLEFHQGGPALHTAKRAAELARPTHDRRLLSRCLGMYVVYALSAGDLEGAQEHMDEVLQLLHEFGDRSTLSFVHINLGNTWFLKGDMARAEEEFLKCLEVRKQSGDERGIGAVHGALGYVYEERGEFERAIAGYKIMMRVFAERGSRWDLGGGLPPLALDLIKRGKPEQAAQLLGCADEILTSVNGHRDAADTVLYERRRTALVETLGEQDYAEQHAIGSQINFKVLLENLFPESL